MRATAAEWSERVQAWRESGQTAPAFAEGKGYSASLLRWWGSELSRRSGSAKPVRLARVVRRAQQPEARLTVAVGAARIEVHAGFDRTLLRELVDALGAGR
jgi:transposase